MLDLVTQVCQIGPFSDQFGTKRYIYDIPIVGPEFGRVEIRDGLSPEMDK